jgi:hypothetical protein
MVHQYGSMYGWNFQSRQWANTVSRHLDYVLQKALMLAEGPQLSELLTAAGQQLAYARRAKCSPGHRNRDKQLESSESLTSVCFDLLKLTQPLVEVILNRSRH